jgi:hypothetical protein
LPLTDSAVPSTICSAMDSLCMMLLLGLVARNMRY